MLTINIPLNTNILTACLYSKISAIKVKDIAINTNEKIPLYKEIL